MAALVYGVMLSPPYCLPTIQEWLARFCQGAYRFDVEPSPPAVVRVFFESPADRTRFQNALIAVPEMVPSPVGAAKASWL